MTAPKFTREEALAWAREQPTIPDELVLGHPLPVPDFVGEALFLAEEVLTTPSKCLVENCKCELALEYQARVDQAVEAIRKAKSIRAPRAIKEVAVFMAGRDLPSVLATSESLPPCPTEGGK